MGSKTAEGFFAQALIYLLPLASVFFLISPVTDPVNVTKFLSVGLLAFGSLALFLVGRPELKGFNERAFFITLTLFLTSLMISLFFSGAPIRQSLYGVYGRNTGLLTYFTLIAIALSALLLKNQQSFKQLLNGLFLAGIANLIYCGWVLLFGDPIGWSNPYGAILGFFGNPDFISAFLGMFVTVLLSTLIAKNVKWHLRILALAISTLALYEIYRSHAQQGFIVTAIGAAFILFNVFRGYEKLRPWNYLYISVVMILGAVATFGALNHGPLSFLHKQSVIFRGWYWHAAITMGLQHPFTGVGLDGYGDWYRRARSVEAATSALGSIRTADAAHNVVLDMFASGGFPLLLTYLAVLGVVLRAIVLQLKRSKSYDPVFVGLASVWIAYQAQSFISLNQIGLTVWGWVFSGALVAYEIPTRSMVINSSAGVKSKARMEKSKKTQFLTPQSIFLLGAMAGLIILLPPFLSDVAWESASKSQNLSQYQAAMKRSYFAPENTHKYIATLSVYDQSNLLEEAHTLNLKALEFNADSFSLWKSMYLRKNSSKAEKAKALENLHRLDPHNLDVTAP
jgi:O-antigen ligase